MFRKYHCAPQGKRQPFFQFSIYAKTTFLYQIRIYAKSTCVLATSPTRRVSDINAMFCCIFNLCDVRMRIAITCIVPGATSEVLLKKKSVSGGSFIRGKSVQEELSCRRPKNIPLRKHETLGLCLRHQPNITTSRDRCDV